MRRPGRTGKAFRGFAASRTATGVALLVATLFFIAVPGARSAYAYDEVDAVVDAFATAGAGVGVTVGTTEKELVKSLVRCAAGAAQSNPLLNCARDELIKRLPKEAQPLAGCLLRGDSIPQCARTTVLSQLLKDAPPDARPFADCLLGGGNLAQCARKALTAKLLRDAPGLASCLAPGANVPQCAQSAINLKLPPDAQPLASCLLGGKTVLRCMQDEIASRLPNEAKPFGNCLMGSGNVQACAQAELNSKLPAPVQGLSQCIAQGTQVVECGRQFAVEQPALRDAFATFERLKVDAATRLTEVPSSIQNILRVVQGVREDRWDQVMIYGGIEVYKTAGKILLRIFLPAPVAASLDPAVDAMVQQRAELFVNTLKAAQARDERKLGELAVEAYVTLNLPLVQGCALIPAGAFKEVTCGNMGKALQALSEGGGEVTSFVVDTTKDALDAVGLLDPVDEIISGRVLSGKEKPEVCGTSERWYATNYLQCLHRGAYLVGKDLNGLLGSLNAACRDNYIRCHIGSTVDRICPPLNASFAKQALDAHNGLAAAADAYTRSIRSYVESKGARACEPDFEQIEIAQFVGECESALRKAIPLAGDPTNADCRAPAQQFSAPSAHREACRWAVEQSNARYVMRDVCFNCGGAKDVERELNLAAEAWVRSLRWWVGLHTADFCAAGADVRAATSRFVDACEGQLKSASMPDARRCAFGARQSPAAPRDACLRALPQVEGVGPSAVVQEMCDYCRSSPGSCAPGPVPPPATMATRPPHLVPPPPVAPPPPSTIAAQPPRLVPPPPMQMPADNMPLKPPHLVLPAPTSPPPPVVATRPPVALPTPVVCPAGSVFRGGRCIQDIAKAPPRCRDGMVPKAGGGCDCPAGSVFRDGRCTQAIAKAPFQCRGGMVPKIGGGCDCPQGSVFRGGTCVAATIAATCSGGMVGTPPNCRCPQGTIWRRAGLGKARCLPPAAPKAACPPGMARDSTGFCGPK